MFYPLCVDSSSLVYYHVHFCVSLRSISVVNFIRVVTKTATITFMVIIVTTVLSR
jgi:hypothetical protein